METISIKDDDGKVYAFEKPEFECELLKVIEDKIIGWFAFDDGSGISSTWWELDGKTKRDYCQNLTPIKPKWYEDESNFPAFVINIGYSKSKVILNKSQAEGMHMDRWRLGTKEEYDSLYYDGKKL